MVTKIRKSLTVVFLILLSIAAYLPAEEEESSPVQVELVTETSTVSPETAFQVAIHFTLDKGWHTYWKSPGDTGMPISIEWDLPPGYKASDLKWPYPKRVNHRGMISYIHEGELYLLAEITPPKELGSQKVPIRAQIRSLVCSEGMCLPQEVETEILLLPSTTPAADIVWEKHHTQAKQSLPCDEEVLIALADSHFKIQLKDRKPKKVYFCPEDLGLVDETVEPTISDHPDQNGDSVITLKTGNGNAKVIKGVLVMHDANDHEEAIAINTVVMGAPPLVKQEETSNTASLFILACALAFLGGMILNLMPCVLPVISFKVLSFVKMAGESRSVTFKHGLAFAAGVIASFWVLAGVLIGLTASGQAVGWGFQLQNPLFVAILTAVIFTFGLSLFGLFEFGTSLTSLAGRSHASSNDTFTSSFLGGVLATAIATPCTGPFLGTAIGVATTLPAVLGLITFTFLGLGMATPYLLLSAFPSLLRFVPKPGQWMVTFKECTGFLMIATAVWLLWVFSAQTNSLATILMIGALFFLSIAAWVMGKWGTPLSRKGVRWTSYTVVLLLSSLSLYTMVTASSPTVAAMGEGNEHIASAGWERFDAKRIKELRKQGKPVFVDFTAKWCLTCQANHLILSTSQVGATFEKEGVVKMKADWTTHDAAITEALSQFGRSGVPLYVFYPADLTSEPVILPQILTPDSVIGTIVSASKKK